MIRLMIAAPASGSGKTAVCCALLRLLRELGHDPCAFKCGPDYIDPMFHRAALGVESHNLDLFLSDEAFLKAHFARACRDHGAAVVEAAMGYYDGLGGVSDRASAWAVAGVLELPVLLVLPARGASLSLAAQLRGLRDFRADSHIAGVVLNECSPALCRTLAPVLEAESGVPVLGCLPKLDAAKIESRHLGLKTAGEVKDLDERLSVLARSFEENVDLPRLLRLFDSPAPALAETDAPLSRRCRLAVARDAAFCFTYAETLEAFAAQGAEPVFFSPLHDEALPKNTGGLYLPGGYPELYARRLSENAAMRRAILDAVKAGLPTVAECGGFLYLTQSLAAPDGTPFPMVGALPGAASDAGRLVRFGYAELQAERDSLLFRAGERFPAHEFHRWDTSEPGAAFQLTKPLSGRSWRGGFASDTLYAAFPHLYFAGHPVLVERFVRAAKDYGEKYGIM